MENQEQYFVANKINWNQRVAVHKDSSFYDLEGFKNGKNVLTLIELNEVRDVKGKSLLHLQCHFGLDTMSWSRLGAKCVGVDLSDEAIKLAREINEEAKSDARFICCNVYDLKDHLDEKFDIVFTSYGTIGWLPDLNKWAELISYYLKQGGVFYIADFHPVLWMFDDEFKEIKYSYENREVIVTENQGTYTDRNAAINGKEYGWNHSISELINSLISAGLKIEMFNEYMYSPYPCFNNMIKGEDGNYRIKGLEEKIPMVYSLRARKAEQRTEP